MLSSPSYGATIGPSAGLAMRRHYLPLRPTAALAAEPPAPAPTINDIFELCEDHQFHLGYDGADEEQSAEGLLQIVLVALARWSNQPPAPEADAALSLAAIIRQVDGSNSLGAAALAEAILSHPDAASVFQPPAPDHIPGATEMVGDGEREELAQWLDTQAEYYECLSPEGSAKACRAAALLRQPAHEGLFPVEYWHMDSGARIFNEPSEEQPSRGCWVVRNSRHVNPCTEFPTVAAALAALQPPQGGEVAG